MVRLIACAVLALLLLARPSAQETIDRVMAVVVGNVITLSDVKAAQDLGLVDPGRAADPVRQILSRLIDRALVLDEAERYVPPEPTPDAIENAVRGIRSRFDTDRAFAATLARVGVSEQGLRQTLRENLRIQAYLDQRFPAATEPERRGTLIQEWVAGLRRRAEILDLYVSPPEASSNVPR
jgi:hypothetical protein